MNKKKILLIVFAVIIVAVGIVAAVVSQKEKEMDPEEFLERFEQAAEEVLGEDIQQVSKTELVASTVRRCKRAVRDDNSALVLVLPYATAEYRNNEQSFHAYYDEIEICSESAEKHFKSAHQIRNRTMVDRSDLVVFCVEHNSGGAYQTLQYAKKANANIINLPDVTR